MSSELSEPPDSPEAPELALEDVERRAPSLRPRQSQAPPLPPFKPTSSLRDHWKRGLGLLALAGVVLYALVQALSSGLDYERVGPRMGRGRKLVILLHGYGADGEDLEDLAEQVAQTTPNTTFLLPDGPHRVAVTGRAWVPDMSAPTREAYARLLAAEIEKTSKLVWQLIDRARRAGVSCTDVYVGGFSQGGRMAVEVALRAPPDCPLGGLISMSGGGMDEVPLPSAAGRPPMRVLITHGEQDTIVSFGTSVTLGRHFAGAGHEVRWIAFNGAHRIAPVVRSALGPFVRGEPVGAAPP